MKEWMEYITINPGIRFGKPTIKGTRITVKDVLGWVASGMSFEDIKYDFPELNDDQIRAALSFAQHREEITEIIVTT
jgi:uncharacterized protein (DUF433 family)